ncbi:MAG: LamG domain-containing protein [Gelidibacter sp.]
MKFTINYFLIFAFFALFLSFSCDDEQLDSNIQNAVETILPNSDLANLMQDISATDSYECVDFQYPIAFTLYNANFQVVETITIQSDEALSSFLQGLGESDNGVVLASLNFPVTLVYDNGTTIEVDTNQELETALMAAADNCGETTGCDLDTVRAFLVSCSQIPTLNGFTPSFTTFEFYDSNELFTLYELDLPHSGTWDIAMIEGEVHVFINFNGLENFNGEYSIMDCSEDTLVLQQGDDILMLNRDCGNGENPFECFNSFDAQITLCDELNDGVEIFDLTQVFANCITSSSYNLLYYVSLADAESGTNPIANPESFTNYSNPQTIYVKVEFEGTVSTDVYEISLILDNCDCNNPGTMTNDLVLYMPFGNQAKDLISGNEAANITNNFVSDRDGNATCAIAFDGNQSFSIPVTTQNQLVQGNSFSISLWYKMQNNDPANLEVFFQKGEPNATQGFGLGVHDLNKPVFFSKSGGFSLWENNDNLNENTEWQHLVVTVDANNSVRLFRNGTQVNVDESATLNIGDSPLSNFIIGEGFEGYLDDLRVYKRWLSPNEVSELYNLSGDCYQCL